MPPLDLSKVKGYEEHLKDKMQQKKAQQALIQKQQSSSQEHYKKQEKAPAKHQMTTLQHHSTKVNNFVGSAELKKGAPHHRSSYEETPAQQPQRHSLSPRNGGKSTSSAILQSTTSQHVRRSQEPGFAQEPTAHYYSQAHPGEVSRSQNNFSATIDASMVQEERTEHLEHDRLMSRKRSVPAAQVHIPLLDFSKLHKPQQPTQGRAATKNLQPKQSMSQSKY